MGKVTKVSETCSCGAAFDVTHRNAVALLREWRKVHKCQVTDLSEVQGTVASVTSSAENALGFQIIGLESPSRRAEPDWDDVATRPNGDT
jgi:hypothetical protein